MYIYIDTRILHPFTPTKVRHTYGKPTARRSCSRGFTMRVLISVLLMYVPQPLVNNTIII